MNDYTPQPAPAAMRSEQTEAEPQPSIVPPILQLPIETLQLTVCMLDPLEIPAISQTCRAFRDLIYGPEGAFVWRSLFLQTWDDPRLRTYLSSTEGWHSGTQVELETALNAIEFDWKTELQRRFRALKMLHGAPRVSCQDRKEGIKAFLSTIQTAAPGLQSSGFKLPPSKNGTWVKDAIDTARLLNNPAWPRWRHPELYSSEEIPDIEETALRSELHTYFGLTEGDLKPPELPVEEPTPEIHGTTDDANGSPDSNGSGSSTGSFSTSPFPLSSTGQRHMHHTRTTSDFIIRLLGLPDIPSTSLSNISIRTAARAFVYNRDNYIPSNKFAPILSDLNGGFKPYWKHLEYLMVVTMWNLYEESPQSLLGPIIPGESDKDRAARLCPPDGLDALRPHSAPGWGAQLEAAAEWERKKKQSLIEGHEVVGMGVKGKTWNDWDDWAGVEGRWSRAVCFMDYRDFARYNFQLLRNGRRHDASIFEESNFMEATRIISVELRIQRIESFTDSRHSAAAVRLNRPRIHFTGTSWIPHPDGPLGIEMSKIRGFVECLASEDIRWQMVSIFSGEERWSSEGIQIGGVGSARGVIGCWTGVDHDVGDPVGPYCLWKVAGRESLTPK